MIDISMNSSFYWPIKEKGIGFTFSLISSQMGL
jgi:hypothetical protein